MGLRDQITAFFRGSSVPEKVTTDETAESTFPTLLYQRFAAETERKRVVEACMLMYRSDPRAKKMLRTMARDIVRGGFVIQCQDKRALESANGMLTRTGLQDELDDYVRMAARDGDLMLEVGVNENRQINEVTRKPTLMMHRDSNLADKFSDPKQAYWMAETYYQQPGSDALWFADWQIVHARWDHDKGERYGSPMFGSGTSAFKRVVEGETDVSVRRKTRAGMRYMHVVEGASEADLKAYKELNKPALNNPMAAVADFFSNKAGSLQAIQGDGNLEQIGDVQHHIATWLASGEVPMELIVYGEGMNRDVLGEKKSEYDETLEVLRNWVAKQIIQPLVERQWLLDGIFPASVKWAITWRSRQVVKAADIRDVADAAMRLRILGVPETVVQIMLTKFLPGVDLEMLNNPDSAGNDAERMALIMQQMRGGLA